MIPQVLILGHRGQRSPFYFGGLYRGLAAYKIVLSAKFTKLGVHIQEVCPNIEIEIGLSHFTYNHHHPSYIRARFMPIYHWKENRVSTN